MHTIAIRNFIMAFMAITATGCADVPAGDGGMIDSGHPNDSGAMTDSNGTFDSSPIADGSGMTDSGTEFDAASCDELTSGPPNVTGLTGVFSAGRSVTVTGTGFGAKAPAAPVLWETFDDGADGAYLSTNSDWPAYGDTGATYSSVSPHSGGLCVYNWVSNAAPRGNGFATNNFHFAEADELYYSYLYRHDGTSVGPAVQKNGRINATGNLYNGPGVVALSDSYVYYDPDDRAVYPADDNGTGRYFSSEILGSSSWTRHQIYGRLSTPSGAENGLILVSVGREEKTFADIVTRAEGYSFQFESVILGLMFANINTVPGAYHDMYVDDVYIDNTRARVEVCEGATWPTRGECHPQPPTAWCGSAIEITVNAAQWSDGQTLYLYVVNAEGQNNANGLEMTLVRGSAG